MPDIRQPARRGRLFILSAPSGAGKSTLCRELRRRMPELGYSVSFTTRPPRPGEREGVDYHFIDRDTFQAGIEAGRWAEWAEVHGHCYGTSAAVVEAALAAGRDLLLDIDVQGARQLRRRFPESVTIFIEPPSLDELARRLRARGTDAEAVIARRLANAEAELDQRHTYRYRVVNDRLEAAAARLAALVEAERAPEAPAG